MSTMQISKLPEKGKRTGVTILSKDIPKKDGMEDEDAFFEAAQEETASLPPPAGSETKEPEKKKKHIRFSLDSKASDGEPVRAGSNVRKLVASGTSAFMSPSELSRASTAPPSSMKKKTTPLDDAQETTLYQRTTPDSPDDFVVNHDDDEEPAADEAAGSDEDDELIPPAPPEEDDDDDEPVSVPQQEEEFQAAQDDDDDNEGPGFQLATQEEEEDDVEVPEEEDARSKKSKKKKKHQVVEDSSDDESEEEKLVKKKSKSKKKRKKMESDDDEESVKTAPKKKTKTTKNRFVAHWTPKGVPQERTYNMIPLSDMKESPDSNEKTLRRSKRVRYGLLEWWRGETVEYGPNNFDDEKYDSVKNMPVIKAVKRADPTPYKPRKVQAAPAQKKKEPAKKGKKGSEESAADMEMEPFDASRLRKKVNIMDGDEAFVWDDCIDQACNLSKSWVAAVLLRIAENPCN